MTALARLVLAYVVLVLAAGLLGDVLAEGTMSHIAAIVATSTALLATIAVLVRLPRAASRRQLT